nr:helix-turn-helix transcriptional regulator [Kitasatospora mediocidica]
MRNTSKDSRGTELGRFLQSYRKRLRPSDIGIDEDSRHRRVQGLRREEVAQLAGVSVNYYTRLEQGQSRHASPEVLDALARALRLDGDERAHLHALARPAKPCDKPVQEEQLRPGLAGLVDAFSNGPSVIIGRTTDLLAWNRMAQLLFTDHLGAAERERAGRMNLARFIFLDPYGPELYPDWAGEARDIVAYLRMMAGRYPADPRLAGLIEELSLRSAEFSALWSAHAVRDKTHGVRIVHHPLVGRLSLDFETLRLPEAPDQCLVIYQAKAGSPSAAGLRQLHDVLAARHAERDTDDPCAADDADGPCAPDDVDAPRAADDVDAPRAADDAG